MTSQLITDQNSQQKQIFTTTASMMMGRFQIASIVTTLLFSQISLAYRLEPSPETNSIFSASVPSSSHSSSNLSQKHGVKVFYQSGVSSFIFDYF